MTKKIWPWPKKKQEFLQNPKKMIFERNPRSKTYVAQIRYHVKFLFTTGQKKITYIKILVLVIYLITHIVHS